MVRSRSYFSTPYFCGAARFARDALAIEKSVTVTGIDLITHRAFVVASVTSAAAALESMINEIFCDANEPVGSCIAELSDEARGKLSTIWAIPKTSSYPILDKFDVAHLLITGNGIDRSDHSWRNATWLARLRNEFVHFEPTWSIHSSQPSGPPQSDSNKFEKALRGMFPENRLTGSGNAFFPDKLLGHGCAAWAVESALAFADNFWSGINAVPQYETYRHMFVPR
jgi:hypothetical protein